MDCVKVDLKNCYGIKALKYDVDFSKTRAYAIYAPNGAMKSSFALTFKDLSTGAKPRDRIFPDRPTSAVVTDEKGAAIENDRVLVVLSYDEEFAPSEKTCTLLVDPKLRAEFAKLQVKVDDAKKTLLELMKLNSKPKMDLEAETSLVVMKTPGDFRRALIRIREEIAEQKDAPLSGVLYDKVFSLATVDALNSKDLKAKILEYITRYNELLEASTFSRKGVFDYYNASEIATSLTKNGFFNAHHTVNLKSCGETKEILTKEDLEAVIEQEKQAIIKDEKLI